MNRYDMDTHPSPCPDLPDRVRSNEELDELLSRPTDALVRDATQLRSPLVVLGASGKMGPSLCLLARRAAEAAGHPLEIIAVSRFSSAQSREWLESHGIQTVSADLLEREAVARLPDSPNLVYLVGLKFGTQQAPWLTWAVNTVVPSLVAERYSEARIVALSTGNVYPYVSATNGGASEELPLAPVGEYGTAALARERIFEYFSRKQGTPTVLLRLNYAVELRYGVLIDIAQKIWAGEAIDVTTGYFNCIWQRDANEMILRSFSLAASPAAVFNLTGPGALSVREIAHQLGTLMGREPKFTSSESSTALVSNASRLCQKLGPPPTSLAPILQWTAAWVQQGGACLGKPTHFEVRSGGY